MSHTVTPTIEYNSDGSEYVSYGNASIEDSRYTEYIGSRGIEQDAEGDYYFDQETQSYRHRFADIDPEELESRLEPQYDTDQEYYTAWKDLVGGPEAYQGLVQWASHNLPEDQIRAYDAAVTSNDPQQIEEAINWLYQTFEEQNENETYEENDSYDPQVAELAEIAGRDPDYQGMLAWAGQNLSPDLIQSYDEIMDHGSYEEICQAIERLQGMYAQSNYTYL